MESKRWRPLRSLINDQGNDWPSFEGLYYMKRLLSDQTVQEGGDRSHGGACCHNAPENDFSAVSLDIQQIVRDDLEK